MKTQKGKGGKRGWAQRASPQLQNHQEPMKKEQSNVNLGRGKKIQAFSEGRKSRGVGRGEQRNANGECSHVKKIRKGSTVKRGEGEYIRLHIATEREKKSGYLGWNSPRDTKRRALADDQRGQCGVFGQRARGLVKRCKANNAPVGIGKL